MRRLVPFLSILGAAVALADVALANPRRPSPTAVPEIDASTGLLAVAAVLAALAFAWELRRRRSA